MKANIVLLPGDGIGVEIVAEARVTLDAVAAQFGHSFTYTEHLIGGCAIDAAGTALTQETLDACRAADAVLLGAVGGPKWDNPNASVRPEQGLLALRKELGVYANLRPARDDGIDLVIVRELVGGLYFGAKGTREDGTWFDTCEYTRPEVERIARTAFALARERGGHVTSVDKVNVMHTSRLWRDVVTELGAAEYPDVPLEHALVDSFAMTVVNAPETRLRMCSWVTLAWSEPSGMSKHITANEPTNSPTASMPTRLQNGPSASAAMPSPAGKRIVAIAISGPTPMHWASGRAMAAPRRPPDAPMPRARPIVPASRPSVRLANRISRA